MKTTIFGAALVAATGETLASYDTFTDAQIEELFAHTAIGTEVEIRP